MECSSSILILTNDIIVIIGLVTLCYYGGELLKKIGTRYIQEAAISIAIGIIAAYIFKAIGEQCQVQRLLKLFVPIFLIVLLPPIIFESGYNLNTKKFIGNFGSILLYAFVGTFLATVVSTIMFFKMPQFYNTVNSSPAIKFL